MTATAGKRRMGTVCLYLLCAGAVVLLAWWLGSVLGKSRAASIASEKRLELHSYLDQHLRPELSEGRIFPDLQLSSPGSQKLVRMRDVLPRGGLLIYVSTECPICMEVVDSAGALAARGLLSDSTSIIVTSGRPEALASYMGSHGIKIPILSDVRNSLPREFGAVAQPCFFFLDSTNVVRWHGAGEFGLSDLIAAQRIDSSSDDHGSERR